MTAAIAITANESRFIGCSPRYSFEILWLPEFATQMFVPSKATALGALPTAKVPSTVPSVARSLVTVASPLLATQMLAPSKTTPSGEEPTAKRPRKASICGA